MVFLIGDKIYRRWNAPVTKETEHYIIESSASAEQTEEMCSIAEIGYEGYKEYLRQLGKTFEPHPKLKMKFYKDREEFRRCNRVTDWREAYYLYPYCYQYYDADEDNPYFWATHEAIHQLNWEAARLVIPQWINEGMACYISTSKIIDKSLRLGDVDKHTYPVWWFDIIAVTEDLKADKANISIIPLRAIVSGQNGPEMDKYFNLYYMHWWSLTYFLMNYGDGRYRDGFSKLIDENGTVSSFESNIGKIEDIEAQWYQYVIELKEKYR
jgi:hypothetical protein